MAFTHKLVVHAQKKNTDKPLPLRKSSKKNEYVPKEKKAKNPQNLSFCQKNDLNFAISKFSKFF